MSHTDRYQFGWDRRGGGAALFLASDASSYVTGSALGIDGGTLA